MKAQHQERLSQWKIHDSIRGYFAYALYSEMAIHEQVWLLTGDLGYGMFDAHKEDFPERFINCGASEQAMIGIACGLALSGKVPFCYSITSFLLYRPFEWIRNYLENERFGVKLVGSGMETDYKHDGFTHHCPELMKVLDCFPHIARHFPTKKEFVGSLVAAMVGSQGPDVLILRR